jgi:magnesium-transporting ATPase (P-type)
VYATGMKTEVGKIALQLVQGSRTRMLTPLQEALNKLSGLIAMISIGVLFFVLAIAIASSYKDPSNKSENQFLNVRMMSKFMKQRF